MTTFADSYSKLDEIEELLKKRIITDQRMKDMAGICYDIIVEIKKNVGGFDRDTGFNRRSIGRLWDNFDVTEIATPGQSREFFGSRLKDLFIFLTRCYQEKYIRTPHPTQKEMHERLRNYYVTHSTSDTDETMEAEFLLDLMPKYMLLELSEVIHKKGQEVEVSVKQWTAKVAEFDDRLQKSEQLVKQYQQEYNFVGLAHAFKNLIKEKETQRRSQLAVLIGMGAVVLYPLACQVFGWWGGEFFKVAEGTPQAINYSKLVPLFGAEILLLYYFRIVLLNYYSVKAQLLQLDLRYAICSFIESYADFAASKKSQAGDTLSKFESLVFSGIVPDLSNVPSTFDGIDQIAKLIREVKKK